MFVLDDFEGHEVTCPFCAETRQFSEISGSDGAGTWLLEHREFHHYELLMIHLDQSFGEASEYGFGGAE